MPTSANGNWLRRVMKTMQMNGLVIRQNNNNNNKNNNKNSSRNKETWKADE